MTRNDVKAKRAALKDMKEHFGYPSMSFFAITSRDNAVLDEIVQNAIEEQSKL